MEVNISARHFELTPALKFYARDKISKIENYLGNVLSCHIVLFKDRYLYAVEVTIHSNHSIFTASAKSKNMYASIDMVVQKLKNQFKKHKNKSDRKFMRIIKKGGIL